MHLRDRGCVRTLRPLFVYATAMTLDDLELLLKVRFFGEFREISHISEATTAKRMNIDPYCQRQR